MVSVDEISQEALESIGIEDQDYKQCRRLAKERDLDGKDVREIQTVRVEPGIQGRPFPVITGSVDNEQIWWDPRSNEWVKRPIFQENY